MKFLTKPEALTLMNQLGSEKRPFFFIISYDQRQNVVIALDEINPQEIAFDFQGTQSNFDQFLTAYQLNEQPEQPRETAHWKRFPIDFTTYQRAFTPLLSSLQAGDIHLANLTFPTPITCNLTLPEIFARTQAKYRIFLKDHFCVFSPETFVTINNGKIATFPMKGTINAALPDAEKVLLENPKELDEHNIMANEAINDIALVAKNAHIARFRYIDRVTKGNGTILQTSSIIEGDLADDYSAHLGEIFFTLTPASSITGAERQKATEILGEIETYQRGFYSGVAGIFDGENVDSTVLIRYLEKSSLPVIQQNHEKCNEPSDQSPLALLTESEMIFNYTFKSGGGITAKSDAKSEYHELIEKIYLPIS